MLDVLMGQIKSWILCKSDTAELEKSDMATQYEWV